MKKWAARIILVLITYLLVCASFVEENGWWSLLYGVGAIVVSILFLLFMFWLFGLAFEE